MRIFISPPLPKDLTDYLQTLVPLLPKAPFSTPLQYDLTVKFLGEVPDNLLPELHHRLSSVHFPPFQANLSRLRVFSEQIIRVVWVGVEPTRSLFDLHSQIDEALFPLFPKDDRFTPHITLGRIKHLHNQPAFLERLPNIHVEPFPFLVCTLSLFKSVLTSKGAIHTPLFEIN
jgi:RNA 2',3'-cyclic 3'-phosphodiesterase